MRISTKGRYGVRLMVALAKHYGKGPLLLGDAARIEEISEKYLGQLTIPLKLAGLINSTRGAHGGYTLAKKPKEIKLSEVVQAVEGPLAPVECVKNPEVCHRINHCVSRDIWKEIGRKMLETLDAVTLQDMLDRQIKKEKETAVPAYNI